MVREQEEFRRNFACRFNPLQPTSSNGNLSAGPEARLWKGIPDKSWQMRSRSRDQDKSWDADLSELTQHYLAPATFLKRARRRRTLQFSGREQRL